MTAGQLTAPGPRRNGRLAQVDLRVVGILLLLMVYAVGGTVTYLALSGYSWSPVVLPTIALLAAAFFFFLLLWLRERTTPVHIGGFTAAMIVLYALYPVVIFAANGFAYTTQNDIRFWISQPTIAQIGELTQWYAIYFIAFAAAYLLTCGNGGRMRLDVRTAPRGIVWIIAGLAAVIEAIRFATGSAFDLSSENYVDSYAVVARLPQIVRQILVNAMSMRMTLLVLVLCLLFAQYRRNRMWIVLMLLWIVGTKLRVSGARSELFALLLVAGILYHNFARRISMYVAALGALFLLALLMTLGALRSGGSASATQLALGTSEFETILANAYDLKYTERASGVTLTQPEVYFADFASVVPQQLLPFRKTTKPGWYVETYYPAAASAGVGFAFGILSEAVTGFGWPELIVRGILVGLLFGWLQRSITRKSAVSIWQLAFYVWIMVWSFQTIRSTSFGLLQWAEYHFLVPMLTIRGLYFLLHQGGKRLVKQRPAALPA